MLGDGLVVKVNVEFGDSFQGPILNLLNSEPGFGCGFLNNLFTFFARDAASGQIVR